MLTQHLYVGVKTAKIHTIPVNFKEIEQINNVADVKIANSKMLLKL